MEEKKDVSKEIVNLFMKLDTVGKMKTAAFLGLCLMLDGTRPKTPDERIDEWVAGGCVGQCDTRGFTRENFERLSSLMPNVPVQC